MTELNTVVADLPSFDRHFWDGAFHFTRIGTGALGGKASGLAFAKDLLAREIDASRFSGNSILMFPRWPSLPATALTSSLRGTISANCLSKRCPMTASGLPLSKLTCP